MKAFKIPYNLKKQSVDFWFSLLVAIRIWLGIDNNTPPPPHLVHVRLWTKSVRMNNCVPFGDESGQHCKEKMYNPRYEKFLCSGDCLLVHLLFSWGIKWHVTFKKRINFTELTCPGHCVNFGKVLLFKLDFGQTFLDRPVCSQVNWIKSKKKKNNWCEERKRKGTCCTKRVEIEHRHGRKTSLQPCIMVYFCRLKINYGSSTFKIYHFLQKRDTTSRHTPSVSVICTTAQEFFAKR
jgi:hypothetical protein